MSAGARLILLLTSSLRLGGAVLTLLALIHGACAQAPEAAANIIFINARAHTLDKQSRIVEAIAIRNNYIVFAGSNEDAKKYAGPLTRMIDAGGRSIIPGLIDSHIHAIRAGLTFSSEVSFAGARTIAEAMKRLEDAALRLPRENWIIIAGGWTEEQFDERRAPALAEVLAAAPDHPVYLQIFYRAALLTPKAMDRLGIRNDQDVLPKGVIERDADGRATGWIKGDQLTISNLFERLPKPDLAAQMEGTRAFFAELNSYGVTGVIDPGGLNLPPEGYRAIFDLWKHKQLDLRVNYSISAQHRGRELEEFRAGTQFFPTDAGDAMLRFNGIGEIVTWGMYNNDNPSAQELAQFEELALWAARQRLTMTIHWNRNASVHHLLGIFERVNAKAPIAPLRWSIAHLHDASVENLQRMRALDIGWLMQNAVFFAAPTFMRSRGENLRLTPPLKSAVDMGLITGAGTDAHRVMWYNPFVALQWMVDGRSVADHPTRDKAQLLTREQALALYTRGSAWFAFDENNRGTLEAGKWADLAILSGDYLDVADKEISSLRSLLTMVDGRIVHAQKPFGK